MSLSRRLRSACFHCTFVAIFLIAGCARPPWTTGINDPKIEAWAGRISLQVLSEPTQSFSANFELKGRPERGELTLISPLGSVLAVLRWSPGEALLDSGNQKIQRFDSVDELLQRATGTAVPLTALFAWLRGTSANVNGWSSDLSRHSEGRISARRVQPTPEADLRVLLDQ